MGKKFIILLVFILFLFISLTSVYAYTFSTEDDQWGNIGFLGYKQSGGITVGGSTNRTSCIPFMLAYDGYLDTFSLSLSTYNTPFIFWIDTEPSYERSSQMFYIWDGNNPYDFDDSSILYNLNKNTLYYLCLSTYSQASGTNTITANRMYETLYNGTFYQKIMNNDFNTNRKDRVLLKNDGTYPDNNYLYYNNGAGWISGSEIHNSYTPRNFQICTKATTSSQTSNYCYSRSVDSSTSVYPNDATILETPSSTGEVFRYKQKDGYVESFTFFFYGGTTFSGDLNFNLSHTNSDGLLISTLINLEGIDTSNIDYGAKNETHFNISFSTPILLEENEYYKISLSCDGCSGGTDELYTAYQDSISTVFTEFEGGWQGETSYKFDDTGSGVVKDLEGDIIFLMNFTSDISYSEEDAIDIDFCGLSPVSNCLFYDSFNTYSDYEDLTDYNYQIITDTAYYPFTYYNQGVLVANSTPTARTIYHEFDVQDYTYNEVKGIYSFFLKPYSIPDVMDYENDSQFIVYDISNYCGGVLTNTMKIIFFRYLNVTGNDEYMHINIYETIGGENYLIGTFIHETGQDFRISNTVNNLYGKGYVQILTDTINYEYNINNVYVYDLESNCAIDEFDIKRSGLFVDDDFEVTINSILYYGTTLEDTGETFDNITGIFVYDNQTSLSDALVQGDIGAKLRNMAFTLGFKTTGSLVLFWLIFIIIAILLVSQSDTSGTTKNLISAFIGIIIFVIGWYLGFIPLELFAFLIFIVVIIGGLFMYSKLGSGNVSGGG